MNPYFYTQCFAILLVLAFVAFAALSARKERVEREARHASLSPRKGDEQDAVHFVPTPAERREMEAKRAARKREQDTIYFRRSW
ncbi:MAG: hypothetical protein AABZ58_10420 [Chloroflexota bacterium]